MISGDEATPIPEDIGELPPEENSEPLEPKEFLVQEPESSGILEPLGDEEPIPEGLPDPEGSDSALAVDEMLSAEMVPDEGALLSAEPAPPLPQQPTFQIRFHSLRSDARVPMKKLLESQGVTISDKAWTAAMPVVSQLTEYQLIVLLQAARALGIPADATVAVPAMSPSEDDLALGDLSAIPEPNSVTVETAPSVILPKGEKEVMLCTPDNLPGGTVRESFGLVIAHRSIARRMFREEDMREKLAKELRSVPNRSSAPLPSSHLQILLRDLMLDLRKNALAKGANAVLGVKLEAFPESGGSDPQLEQLRLVAFGTAAVVEKT